MYPSQQNATDQTSNFFWMLALATIALLGLWWLRREWVVIPLFYLRYYELTLFKYLLEAWNHLAVFFNFPHSESSVKEIAQLQNAIMKVDPHKVKWLEFTAVNDWVGRWTRLVISPLLVILSAITYFKFGSRRFIRTYSMQSLRDIESKNWPQITPVLTLDLIKEDIEKGPWAMAVLPLDFCKKHNLISPAEHNERKVWGLDRGGAHRLLTSQVGPLWVNAQSLPIHIKALLVIFLARAERDKKLSNNLLSQIAASAGGGKLNFTGVEKCLQKYHHHKLLGWLESRHAYVYTFMASLLEIARESGVLASAEFLWLKPVDRRLWFMLNSVGRQTAVVEVAGAYSHWKTEKKMGRAFRTPMVDEAVDALAEDMLNTLRIDEGESWHTPNAD